MGREYYPPDDQESVSGNENLQAQAQHAEAQRDEAYFHGVAAFREQFFSKLAAHGAITENVGWAVFGGEEYDNEDIETIGQREVLLFCVNRPERAHSDHPAPLIRVITNEPFITEDGLTYLTEDVTLFEDGRASYFLGAVRSRDQNGALVDDVVRSNSPLFFVGEDNKLIVTTNAGRFTPHFLLQDEVLPDNRVFPYGPATDSSM